MSKKNVTYIRGQNVEIRDKNNYFSSNVLEDIIDDIGQRLEEGGGGAVETFTNSTPTNMNVGGVGKGDTFERVTYKEMMNKIFYPTEYPTITNASSTLSLLTDQFVEVGISKDIIIRANFSRGSISPVYHGGPSVRSGPATSYNYDGGGLDKVISSSTSNTQTISSYIFTTPGSLVIRNSVSYSAGMQPLDSEGNPYSSPLPAGNTGTSSVTIHGVFPIFATTNNVNEMTMQSLTNSKSLEYTLAGETDTVKQSFQWDESFGTLDGVQMYNTLSQQWEYLGGSAVASRERFTESTVQVTLASGVRNYIRYTNNRVKTGSRQLRITIK